MGKAYVSPNAVCPYYKCEAPIGITCDAPCGADFIRINFRDKATAWRFKLKYCRRDWQRCPLADMLELEEKLAEKN